MAQNAPQTVMLAEDEAWMYLQATTMNAWSPVGDTPTVRVDPGRAKVGFFGSLDLKSGQELVTRSQDLTAAATAQHLQLILDTFPTVPILLFWDRAPWHHGQPIHDILAANPRLTLIDFPVAAPELNPQEQVWKKTRRAISHNHPFSNLSPLADSFERHLKDNSFHSSFLADYGYFLPCPFLI